MKKLRLFAAMLLFASVFIGFNACSSDDKDDDGGIEPKERKVTKIVNEYDDYISTETFAYFNGKLSKHTASYNNEEGLENDLKITYEGSKVIMNGLLDGYKATLTYTLTNGLATSCSIISDEEDGKETKCTFKYSDGYLTNFIVQYPNGEWQQFIYAYANGDVEKVQQTEYGNYKFTYSNDELKGGILNPLFYDNIFPFDHITAFHAGILGKSTKHLAIFGEAKEGDFISTNNCVFAIDNEGYVKTAKTNRNKYTYTFE